MSGWWILGHLLLLSAEDLWEGQLYMPLILELGVTGIFFGGEGSPAGWILGLLLLGAGAVSGERIGYGDGWLVLALGMWISWRRLLWILTGGLALAVLCAVLCGKRELPFAPFLTTAYMIGGWR